MFNIRLNYTHAQNRLDSLCEEEVKNDDPDRRKHDGVNGRASNAHRSTGSTQAFITSDAADEQAKENGLDDPADDVLGRDTVSDRRNEHVDVLIVYVRSDGSSADYTEDVRGDRKQR